MMYLVIYFESYVGYNLDENCCVFSDRALAQVHADLLNIKLADSCNCQVADLGDLYVVEEIRRR